MWADPKLIELRERIAKMSDEELLRIVCDDYEDYREEALRFAEAELGARGIHWQDRKAYGGVSPNQNAAQADAEIWAPVSRIDMRCNLCGGRMRPGFLHSRFEVTISFTDNGEERFLEVLACGRCGQVRMRVDYQTDVQN